ncbi:MAG TPA: hypothetical protein PLV93_11755 [Microthrixaceae bacterium]|nr:hypothetical protein [Microthrixaceae bacterium]
MGLVDFRFRDRVSEPERALAEVHVADRREAKQFGTRRRSEGPERHVQGTLGRLDHDSAIGGRVEPIEDHSTGSTVRFHLHSTAIRHEPHRTHGKGPPGELDGRVLDCEHHGTAGERDPP